MCVERKAGVANRPRTDQSVAHEAEIFCVYCCTEYLTLSNKIVFKFPESGNNNNPLDRRYSLPCRPAWSQRKTTPHITPHKNNTHL